MDPGLWIGLADRVFLKGQSGAAFDFSHKLLESVLKVYEGTQYRVILRSMSLMLASRMKASAVRLRFS